MEIGPRNEIRTTPARVSHGASREWTRRINGRLFAFTVVNMEDGEVRLLARVYNYATSEWTAHKWISIGDREVRRIMGAPAVDPTVVASRRGGYAVETITYYHGTCEVWTPVTDPTSTSAGGAYVEHVTCTHRHTDPYAAEKCGRKLGARTAGKRNRVNA
jgi:hypothetical protein